MEPAETASIHARLLAGDPTASADLIEAFYGPLIGHAIKKHRQFGMDQDRARDLALHVLTDIVHNPSKFNPTKGNLFGFLCMALDADAMNFGRDAKNRENIFLQFAVEVQEVGGNTYETNPDKQIDAFRILEKYHADIIVDEGDKEVFRLILEDERSYEPYIQALNLRHLSAEKQVAEVKRRKDRIEKRLRRLKDRL